MSAIETKTRKPGRWPRMGVSHSVILQMVFAPAVMAMGMANPANADETTELEPITVTASGVSPGGVELTVEELERANATSIKDVFDGEASVNVGGGHDAARKIYVNGIEDTNLNVKIDGVRQINSAFHHLGTAIIDPGLLKSVRVENGVGAMDIGPGGLGGSIAYETKDARDILEADQTFGGYTKLQYESNSPAHSEILTVAGQVGAFELLAYGSNDGGDLYEDGDGEEVAGTKPNMKNLMGKAAYSMENGGRIEFLASRLEDAGVRPNRANFGALVNGSPPTYQSYDRNNFSLSYKDELPSDLINPEIVLSYSKANHFIDELAFGAFRFDLNSETTSLNGKFANTFKTDLGFAQSGTVTAGLDFYRDEGHGDISGGFGGSIPLVNTETSDNVGLFLQSRLDLTEKWYLALGARYDQQWFEGIDGTDIDVGGASGSLNLEYNILPWLTGYGGIGSVFGGIPLGESTIYNFASQWTYDGLTNSRSYNSKIGIKGEEGAFSGDFHLYQTRILGSHDRGNATRNSTRNLKSRGINLSGKYQTDEWLAKASYSMNILRSDGVPLNSGSASYHGLQMGDLMTLEAARSWNDLGITAGVSNEFALKDDTLEGGANKTYLVTNLYAQWYPEQFENLTLRMDIKNLFDRTYVARATSGVDNSSAVPFNEPGRSFQVTAKLDF